MNKSVMKRVTKPITKPGGRIGTLAAGFAAAIALSGCGNMNMSRITNPWGGPQEQARLPADAVAYTCSNGKPLYVRYGAGNQFAMVMFPDREFRLDATDGAVGGKYSNGRTNLEVRDGEVTVTEGATVLYGACKRPEQKAG
jgi:membrane-bound inhibitor of C-type lysozyme